jgi:arylsulfatase A-like enzyme
MKWCLTTILAVLALTFAYRTLAVDEGSKPNIVYILADDMGWADVSFNGGEIATPNIDRIARGGAKLAQFYVQPVCSPTRASFMTGRYPMRMGLQVGVIRPWADYGMPLEERTLPAALKQAGYETAICGKWHLGEISPDYLPTHRGFDHQYGHYNGAIDYFTHMRDGGFDWHRDDKACHDEGYSTFLLAKEAVRLIDEHDTSKPLFLYVPFNAVHAPHQVPDKYKEPYTAMQGQRKIYAGMCAAMDESIGTILDAIDKKGIRKNTLILFSSDNGGPAPGKVTSNGPFRAGKGTLYEGGVRVCAAAMWEGHITAGSTVDQPLHMTDWYPTLLKLAGAPTEQPLPLDGKDAWPTIAEGKPTPHEFIVHNSTPKNGAIRMGDWKLVLNGQHTEVEGPAEDGVEPEKPARPAAAARRAAAGAGAEKVELFNIAQDPYEKKNLAAEQPEKLKELRARYDELAAQAVKPKGGPQPKDYKAPKVWGEKD